MAEETTKVHRVVGWNSAALPDGRVMLQLLYTDSPESGLTPLEQQQAAQTGPAVSLDVPAANALIASLQRSIQELASKGLH